MGFADSAPSGPATAPATPAAENLALLEGLARIASAAAVYGAAHARVTEVSESVAAALRSTAAAGPVRIVVPSRPDAAAESGPAFLAARLLRDLAMLGAAHVQFAPETTGADLVAFALFVRRAAAPRAGSGGFANVDFSELPPSVQVVARDFGKPTLDAGDLGAGGDVSDPGGLPPVAAAEAAEERSVDDATRALLHKVVELALREGTPLGPASGESRLPANVREAIRAAAESLCRSLRKQSGSTERTVADILGEAGRLLPTMLPTGDAGKLLAELSRSLDEHMRDAFVDEQRNAKSTARKANKGLREPGPPEDELAESIRAFTAGAQAFEAVTRTDAAEDLSILLHVLGDGVAKEGADAVSRRLAAATARGVEEPERSVLVGWLRAAVGRLNPAGVDAILAPVEAGLRSTAPGVLAQVLAETCRTGGAAMGEPLWPHVAREVLASDDPRDAALRAELAGVLSRVPRSRILDEAPRLVALLPRRNPTLATSAISPPRPELFPLYEVLADLPPESGYARALVQSFSRHASLYPPAAALGGMDAGDERARTLLVRMLRERGDAPEVRSLAAGILVERLRALPDERRDAPWVDGALRALGALPCREADQFLEEVVGTRKWLIGWSWPVQARHAAVEVLERRRAAGAGAGA